MISVVTGGLGGIGAAIVKTLLNRGDTVIVFDILPKEEVKLQNIIYLQTDVSSIDSIKSSFSKLDRIDLLVNNAGITRDGLAIRLDEASWDAVLDVNLKGLFFCSQQALKKMIRQNSGCIINISSIVGITGNPGQANYAASKAGVIALTKTLAQEYGSRNITVNAIAPGFIETEMTEKLSDEIKNNVLQRTSLKRFGKVEEVAALVEFLSSKNANYITGQVISIDGGL